MLFDTAAAALDWLGVIVFAVSGALVASRKQMDIVGFALLGTVTGIGGGTLRDLLLGQGPVFWVREPAYLIVCVVVSGVVFVTAHIPQSRYRVLLWFDALGLALFAVTGAERALLVGSGPVVAVAMGVITATFGGIIRDVLGNESPVVLSREIYVTAALVGAGVFIVLSAYGLGRESALGAGLLAGLVVRGMALRWGWSLPRYRARPEHAREEVKRPE
ncbi:MAG TPA: trimeric intracellular cation channel family protein [Beijerinckiaceae bacterium]|jgi:uncharacterized membrane protein YeiH|nr:trimeric intracellular cation channel family protein [Beijerinckiaceae bacterium]